MATVSCVRVHQDLLVDYAMLEIHVYQIHVIWVFAQLSALNFNANVNLPLQEQHVTNKILVNRIHVKMEANAQVMDMAINAVVNSDLWEEIVNNLIFVMSRTHVFVVLALTMHQTH